MLSKRILGFRPSDPFEPLAMLPPFAAAAYSVLILAAENPASGIRAVNLVAPLLLSFLVAHTAWVASRSVSGDPHRRALLSTAATVILLFFGHFAGVSRRLAESLPVISTAVAAGALVAVGIGLAVAVVRSTRDLDRVTRFLNVTAVLLIGFTGARAALSVAAGMPPENVDPEDGEVLEFPDPDSGVEGGDPDIFLIILDAYSGPTSLRDIYDLDIADFIGELESLGFFVPRASRSNYAPTYLSVASMLDWQYLHEAFQEAGGEREAMRLAFSRLHHNATTRLLRERGYEIAFFRSSYPPLNHSPVADIHIPRHAVADLELMWFQETILPATIEAICHFVPCGSGGLGFTPAPAEIHEARFDRLASVRSSGRPLFVYAHILLPHEPFLFDAECRTRPPLLPRNVTAENEEEVRHAYRDQVACLNRMLLPLARALIEDRHRTPVVIFQSDHGFGRLGLGWSDSLAEADPQRVRERFDIFAAYHVPGGPIPLGDSITPINAFRAIFGSVFELDLPPLEDRSYWSSYGDPLTFSRYR